MHCYGSVMHTIKFILKLNYFKSFLVDLKCVLVFSLAAVQFIISMYVIPIFVHMTRNQINDTFLFQNRVKVKVVGEVSEK